jgi:predicted metalloprotease with PDZ domain
MLKEINYSISFKSPSSHYCEVSIHLKNNSSDVLFFSMPVWTPGSYMIRDFAGKVQDVLSKDSKGKKLFAEKISKNTWRVDTLSSKMLTFSYRVYCNELTVRTSEITSDHAFLNTSGVFMSVKGHEQLQCNLSIDLPKEWKQISTGLRPVGKNKYTADNYDTLIDCPIELGNQKVLEFFVRNVPHRICIAGIGNYDEKKLIHDFTKIAEAQIRFFGDKIPYEHYTYIINLVEKGGGGLEHLNSFAVLFPRLSFSDAKAYRKFLGLVSHEFFHLWNVKRIRPAALGPFDYDRENYTKSLWVAEGWTSFYDNVFLLRAGLINAEEYLEFLEHELNDVMRFTGRFHQALRESSFDTWIKFYKKDENTNNSQVSYYTKGALVATMLNVEIISATNCKRSLDDVLLQLYGDFQKDPSKGFTEERVKQIAEEVCGKNLDDFWKKYLDGTDELPIRNYLEKCGIETIDENEKVSCSLDIETKSENGKLLIAKVFEGGSAHSAGLNSGDEIISVDNYRVDAETMNRIIADKKNGDKIDVLIARKGIVKLIQIKLEKPLPKYKLKLAEKPGKKEKQFLEKWLNG